MFIFLKSETFALPAVGARFDTPAAQKLQHSGNIHWVIDEDATSGTIRINSNFVVTYGKLIETQDIFVFIAFIIDKD